MSASHYAQSWPDENRQFRRRWTEPPLRNGNRRPEVKSEAAADVEDEYSGMNTADWRRLSMAIQQEWRRGRAAP